MRAFLTLALAIVAMMCLLESCGESTGEATPAAPAVPTLEQAIAERGDPCDCVTENKESAEAFLEGMKSMKSMDAVSTAELNVLVSEAVLPCMQPSGNRELDRLYTQAMGGCMEFINLTEVMNEVKEEVLARSQQGMDNAKDKVKEAVGDAKQSASELLDKLKKN